MTDEPIEVTVQPSSEAILSEMEENGTGGATMRWPEMIGSDAWNDAYSLYQEIHEAPEEEREQVTAEVVEIQNTIAEEEGAELADEA